MSDSNVEGSVSLWKIIVDLILGYMLFVGGRRRSPLSPVLFRAEVHYFIGQLLAMTTAEKEC